MAINLKRNTSLQKKNRKYQRDISLLADNKREFMKQQRGINGVLIILRAKWKRFALLFILICVSGAISKDALYLSIFMFMSTIILTLGHSKRPYEEQIAQTDRLISQVQKQARPLSQGVRGETAIAHELNRLPDSYYLINDVEINFKVRVQIDHVVIGPTGIYAIETKSMGGNLKPHINSWLHGNKVIRSPQNQAKRSATVLSSFIGQRVQPVVALSNPKARWHGELDRTCPVLRGPQLVQYILNQPGIVTNQGEIAQRIMQYIT